MRGMIGLLSLLVLAVSPACAQDVASVSGIVRDATTLRTLIGALVTIQASPDARTTRTDARGAFLFSNVARGAYPLSIRLVGYEPLIQQVTVVGATKISYALKPLANLDTVRVRDVQQRIYGVVATAESLRPLPHATVQILGASSGQVLTDSTGHFSYTIRTTGAYVVRGKVHGLGTTTVSVVVPSERGVEVALLLDSIPEPNANSLEMAYRDFHDRLLRRGMASAVVPRSELMTHARDGLVASLMQAHSFGVKGLRFNDEVCVFIDGVPQPGVSPNSIEVASVETVEAYASGSERSGTLGPLWPRNAPCGDTGMPRVRAGVGPAGRVTKSTGMVVWVVVWLKH